MTQTINNVPRELLADLISDDHDKRISAERNLYAMLANAPEPAGGLRGEVAQFKATISDSESVFVNMLRGTIAKPSLRSMVKLYSGEVLNGEDALQLELVKERQRADVAVADANDAERKVIQQAQRIGKLEGLLNRVRQADALSHACPLWKAIDAALAADKR